MVRQEEGRVEKSRSVEQISTFVRGSRWEKQYTNFFPVGFKEMDPQQGLYFVYATIKMLDEREGVQGTVHRFREKLQHSAQVFLLLHLQEDAGTVHL